MPMSIAPILIALAGSPQGGEQSPLGMFIPMALMFAVFYFVLFMPMRQKQKKLDELIKAMKAGDKVIINPGIFGTIVGVEDNAFQVRIDDKTKIKVLKSAVTGLQAPAETEKK
jgi:preprotein translocase subunit YajC